jgi:hypothetical protein
MTLTDWLFDLALIAIVFVQIRRRRLTLHSLLLPIAIVAVVVEEYLRSIPTGAADLALVAACATTGLTLGALAGRTTHLSVGPDGHPYAKAGAVAAVLWVVGVSFRLAFQLWVTHGGGLSLVRFDLAHGLVTEAWVAALILMSLGEVLARTAVLAVRAHALGTGLVRERRPAGIMGCGDPTA